MARRSTAVASLWCLALIACASPATGAADVAASGASRDDGSDLGSIDTREAIGAATRAGPVAVVFVTSRDAESLSPCRAGLLRALRASVADLPDHDVFVLHGGNGTGPMSLRDKPDDAGGKKLPAATMLSQSALKHLVPERLRCDCSSGNGGTPFAFMAWLVSDHNRALGDAMGDSSMRYSSSVVSSSAEDAAEKKDKKEYAFAWYVEEDVVFTGNWAEVFRLRTVSTPESRVREVEVFGELSPASVQSAPSLSDDARDGDSGDDDDDATSSSASFTSSPVDVVAHVERLTSSWKKRCRMPGDGSPAQVNGTGCVGVDGFIHRTWWPVIGISRRFAYRLISSVADENGANGHQEPLTMSFCRLMNKNNNRETMTGDVHATNASDANAKKDAGKDLCSFRLFPGGAHLLGEYQLGHWGRFVGRPKSHPTFTAPGLTYGHNLVQNRLYHPLKCEADAGIGALAEACAGGVFRVTESGDGDAESKREALAERGEGVEENGDDDSSRAPRRTLVAAGGGGGGGGGGDAEELSKIPSPERALRETYFEKKPWALAFDDAGYGGRPSETSEYSDAYGHSVWASGKRSRLETDPVAYAAAMAAAKERNEATREKALAAAKPYARPVRGPKKKTSTGA